jgi:hypothetical protein
MRRRPQKLLIYWRRVIRHDAEDAQITVKVGPIE